MKFLFLLTQDLESPSGLGRFFPLAQEFAKLGHQVTMAALHADFDRLKDKDQKRGEVDVHYVAQMHVRKRENRKFYFSPAALLFLTAWATFKMTWFALRHPADVIYVCKPHPMNSLAGLAGKLLRGGCLWLDCDDYEAAVNRFSGRWQLAVIRFFEDWMPYRVAMVTTNTHFTQERLAGIGVPKAKIYYLPNGVQPSRFPPTSSEQLDALRDRLQIHQKKVIIYVGSLSLTGHPVDLLVRAFALVRQNISESVLLLVGGGEDLDALQALTRELGLANAVIFTGRVPPDEVGSYYRLADVSVDPVNDDDVARGRSPLKLFESWICGVPFVTADVGDRRELVEPPQAGLLARPGDVESLAKAICSVLENPEMAEEIRVEGPARVKHFYWDRLAREVEKAL